MAQIVQCLEERQQWEEERQQQEEERQQREEEYRREQEEYRRQQDEKHREQLKATQEHLQALRERRPTTNSHSKMTPFQESKDIQDFLEAFEGIMGIQNVDRTEWILRLTPLVNGKARAICTELGTMMEYNGVMKAILSHYNVNPEHC